MAMGDHLPGVTCWSQDDLNRFLDDHDELVLNLWRLGLENKRLRERLKHQESTDAHLQP